MTKIIRRRRGHVSGRKPIAPAAHRPTPLVLRRPLTERCYTLLDTLRREGPSGAVQAAWETLRRDWQEAAPGDAADIHAAGLVCYVGWTLAMASGDPRGAVAAMDSYFRHPALDADERVTRVSYRCHLALSLLCAGETGEAVALYRLLLGLKHRESARLALTTTRSQLLGYCREHSAAEIAPTGVASLVRDLAGRLRRKRLASRIVPGEAPFSLLADTLAATYPDREREDGERD